MNELIEGSLRSVFRAWSYEQDDCIEKAQQLYKRVVNPIVYHEKYPSPEAFQHANLCFTEWFMFDFNMSDGHSPLESFLERASSDIPVEQRQTLKEIAASHVFSHFSIRHKNIDSGHVLLRDICSDADYTARLPNACQRTSWERGMLSVRIGCVGGTWHQVGKTMAYDRAPHLEGSRDEVLCWGGVSKLSHRRFADASSQEYVQRSELRDRYLAFVHKLIGVGGRYTRSFHIV